MNKNQCPSCGGFCGHTKKRGCRYVQPNITTIITPKERAEIDAIVKRWDYATEACIEAYLLGKKNALK